MRNDKMNREDRNLAGEGIITGSGAGLIIGAILGLSINNPALGSGIGMVTGSLAGYMVGSRIVLKAQKSRK